MKSSDLRDGYAQKKYREKSKAKDKSNKHVAHYFSLDIAAYLNKFVEPAVPVKTLKYLCNNNKNVRMVASKTNLSRHKQTDNELMRSFENVMLPKFNEHALYKNWLQHNPSKLELEIKTEGISYWTLDWQCAQRATAQAVRVQALQFPNRYTALVRLFYRCFRDSKGRQIWNDTKNSSEFKKYLEAQQQRCSEDGISKEVIQWLKQTVKLPQFIELFTEHAIDDMNIVKMLDIQALSRMGLLKVGHQMQILHQIRALQEKEE